MMITFKKFIDFGKFGICAVFTEFDKEVRLNQKSLEIRIKNLKEQKIDCSVEETALAELIKLSKKDKKL